MMLLTWRVCKAVLKNIKPPIPINYNLYFIISWLTWHSHTVFEPRKSIWSVILCGLLYHPVLHAASSDLANAQWTIFTNRQWISALSLSESGSTLWVATQGGLEKRDPKTNQLLQIFTKKEGLPENRIETVLEDTAGGLWVGTSTSGLAYLSSSGQWTIFNTENSGLPSNIIETLSSDGQGGLWVGTMAGLAHYHSNGEWSTVIGNDFEQPEIWVRSFWSNYQDQLWVGTQERHLFYRDASNRWSNFNPDNSPLPINGGILALLVDDQGGLWIGMAMIEKDNQFVGGGLVHRTADGKWTVFNSDNSKLPHNWVETLLDDGQNGLWIGTLGGGLAHLNANGEWNILNNPHLPTQGVTCLASDTQGGLWVGSFWGVSYFNAKQEWLMTDSENSIPGNRISGLVNDDKGGLWLGTLSDGLAYRTPDEQWEIFNTINSELPTNKILALSADDHDGLWIGTYSGLIHRHADEQWTTFNTENSPLPYNNVSTLSNDGQNGVWVGTVEDLGAEQLTGGGLTHFNGSDQWHIFNTENSPLPSNVVSTLLNDEQNGVWIGTTRSDRFGAGTEGGLAHLSADNQWEVFTIENSSLPANNIETLLSDKQGGLWIGTSGWDFDHRGGLAHFSAERQWTVLNTENSKLPINWITALSDDNKGGLWIGTIAGLLHRNADNQAILFNEENANLPDNSITNLSIDHQGGLWVGTFSNGIAYLSFGRKTELCQQTEVIQCQYLRTHKRAAIIIAGGGAQTENTLWDTTEFISNNWYNVLNKRGFNHDEIYYLTPKGFADFNGDGFDDHIVDAPKPNRPLTSEDVNAALEWAKSKGKLNLPLYLFFMDHGRSNELQLSQIDTITAATFKAFLDDYQMATGNDIILLIEACYSGAFAQQLIDKRFRRAFISSTHDTLAYFDRENKQGFSRFLAKGLSKGMTFGEAFDYANEKQQKLLGDVSEHFTVLAAADHQNLIQIPQLNDGDHGQWLRTHYLNNLSLTTGDDTLAIANITSSNSIPANQAITLSAKTSGTTSRVWATLRPPKIHSVLDPNGTPILAYPRLNLSQTDDETIWQTTWQNAIYNGTYQMTFYAQDNDGNIASSDQDTILTVSGGIDPPASAHVQIHLDQDRYQPGERFKAELIENLSWGFDLYVAVVMPNGHFLTLNKTNEPRAVDEAKPWYGPRQLNKPLTLFDWTLPPDLPTGQYCLHGILSPERANVFETLEKGLWVYTKRCLEITSWPLFPSSLYNSS